MSKGFLKVARTTDVPNRRSRRVRLGEEDVALWHVDNRWYAVSNVCSHQHIAALHQGILQGETLTCHMHGWTYSLETGRAVNGDGRIRTYEVRIEGEDIYLRLPPDQESSERPWGA